MSDLVQRLRETDTDAFTSKLLDEAAAAIEQLSFGIHPQVLEATIEIERLTRELEHFQTLASIGRIQEVVIGNLRAEIDRLTRERDEWKEIADRASVATSAWIGKHERLRARWDEAYRLLNEFRPVTGTNEWVAVRLSALNHVLMGNSSTPLVGPLRGEK